VPDDLITMGSGGPQCHHSWVTAAEFVSCGEASEVLLHPRQMYVDVALLVLLVGTVSGQA
jgi:hypothetical protein